MSFGKLYLSQYPSGSRKPHTFLHLIARENTSLATKTGFGGAFPSILAGEGDKVPDLEIPKKGRRNGLRSTLTYSPSKGNLQRAKKC